MYSEPSDQFASSLSPSRLSYPHLMVVAAVARSDTDRGVALLSAAGFARDRIEVIVVEEVRRLEGPLGGTGLHRFLVRLRLSRGDDLDELEQARRELMNGQALIQLLVHGSEEQHRAQVILSQRSGDALLWAVDDNIAIDRSPVADGHG